MFNKCLSLRLSSCKKFFKLENKKIFSNIIFLILVGWIITKCANPVSPSGGPKDLAPPQVVKAHPPNFTTNFSNRKIVISFNEFVKLKQPNQQVVISPPVKEKPDFKTRGKSVIIDFNKEELKPNTTYTIFFGNSIVDITEDNPLRNYLYVFSTGDNLDSLAIAGIVSDAFNLSPKEEIFVMLYSTDNDTVPPDSLPYLVRPLYISKTGINGIFQLRNLRNEPYKIFALSDLNSNYLYDLPNEEIAFIDSLVLPEAVFYPEPDTTTSDTLQQDSLIISDIYGDYHSLFMFKEIDSTQKLLDDEVVGKNKIRFIFKFPVDEPKLTLLKPETTVDWKIEEINSLRDTLLVWIRDTVIDSLLIKISDHDSIIDTTLIVFKKEKKKKRRKRIEKESKKLSVRTNVKGRLFDLNRRLTFLFDNPLKEHDFSGILFIAGEDTTLAAPLIFTDSIHRKMALKYTFDEEIPYQLIIPDSSFTDIFGLSNDSILIKFRTKFLKEYGNIYLDILTNKDELPLIIQLLSNEKIIVEKYVTQTDSKIAFEYLKPGKYSIKAIWDKNRNGRWDTGNYLKKLQPENVYYYPVVIEVRANWDIEESWDFR